jgi:TIR domain
MARIFISHSSANNCEAIALCDWLAGEGWDDVFLDLDPERGIVAGERWERALNEAANRCEAVLFLVTRVWLGSRWCMKELNLAHRLNKRLFGVLIEDITIAELPPDLTRTWQLVNLAAGSDHQLFCARMPDKGEEAHVTFSTNGLTRLKGGLTKAGLDARFFAWPPADGPNRPPYRGLKPLEAEDAGIFFGREAPVIEVLDRLRGLAEAAPPRFQWINYGLDSRAGSDTCPIVGNHSDGTGQEPAPKAKFVIPADPASGHPPFIADGLPQFVETRGGEYFFVPSMTALRMIGMGVVDPT